MVEGTHVVISAAARLHLGFLDLHGGLGRRFGSIGLAIDGPVTRLSLRRAAAPRVQGPDSDRASAHLAALGRRFGTQHAHALTIHEAIPAHVGLGSGTTLALSVAEAFRRLESLRGDPRQDIRTLARGERSGVGIAVFRKGGFVVDGGRGSATVEPPIVTRLPFPRNWRILLLQDASRRGVHGDDERAAFSALELFGEAEADRICRLVLMQLLPGLVEKRIVPFGEAVRSISGTSRRLFCAGPRRTALHQPRGRGGARHAATRRRSRHRPKFLGSDRLCLRGKPRRGAKTERRLAA